MTPPTGATSSDAGGRGQLAVGDSVEANYFDEGTYYRGQVTAVYPDGSCDILYEDGDDEQQVPPGRIRSLPEPAQGKRTRVDAAVTVVSAVGELRAGKGLVGGFSRRLRGDPMSQGTW